MDNLILHIEDFYQIQGNDVLLQVGFDNSSKGVDDRMSRDAHSIENYGAQM
jgi:hypothetical protein